MKAKDIVDRLPEHTLVTIVNEKGEILVDCDTCDRIQDFGEVDAELHRLLRFGSVYKIEVGQIYKDLILSVVVEK